LGSRGAADKAVCGSLSAEHLSLSEGATAASERLAHRLRGRQQDVFSKTALATPRASRPEAPPRGLPPGARAPGFSFSDSEGAFGRGSAGCKPACNIDLVRGQSDCSWNVQASDLTLRTSRCRAPAFSADAQRRLATYL